MSSKLPIFKIAGDKAVPTLKLDRDVCVVGRASAANLTLAAPQVSKLHALVIRDAHGVYVRDLASKNGVEVNGSIVSEAQLRNDDVLRIGSYTLKCETGFTQESSNGLEAPPAELRADEQSFAFPADRHTLLIGSRDGCDVKLAHASVAPVHAVIFEADGKRCVHTFAPTSTTINGGPAQNEELHPGDELRVGEVSLHYAPVESEDAAAESPSDAAFIDDIELEPQVEADAGIEAEADLDVVDMGGDAEAVEVEEEHAAVEIEDVADVADVAPVEDASLAGEIELEPLDAGPMDTADNIEPVEAVEAVETIDTIEPVETIEPIETVEEPAPAQPLPPLSIEPAPPEPEREPEPPAKVVPPAPAKPAASAPVAASADELDMTPFDVDPVESTGKPQWLIEAEQESLNATIDWEEPDAEPTPMAPALPELDPAELSASFNGEDIDVLAPVELNDVRPVQHQSRISDIEAAEPIEPAGPVIVEDDAEEEIEIAPEVRAEEKREEVEAETDEESMKRNATPVAAAEASDAPAPIAPAAAEPNLEEITALVNDLSARMETLKSAWAAHLESHNARRGD